MTALEIFRIVATEFGDVSDEKVEQFIELSEPLISEKIFGKLYNQALAYLAAHRMKMLGFGSESASATGTIDDALRIGSYSEGGVSISYSVSGGANALTPDAEYAFTVYGLQYLNLRRLVVIPIRNAGER